MRYGIRFWSTATILLLVVSGCSWQRSRTNVSDLHLRIDRVEAGKTTTAQLFQLLGSPPNNIIALPGGKNVLLYTFGDSKTEAFDLLLVKFAKTNVGIDSALFITDANGVVEEVSVSTNSQDLEWEFWPFGDGA